MRWALAVTFAIGLCLAPASAQAYDTGPHADMTRDALTAEGFGVGGANVGMVNNWFVDYYTNPDDNPFSGHANALVGFLRSSSTTKTGSTSGSRAPGACTSTPAAASPRPRTCRTPRASTTSGDG